MAVKTDADCKTIKGMYQMSGSSFKGTAFTFPFSPVAFITDKNGTFSPQRVKISTIDKTYSYALALICVVL